ncbi:MAG: EamA family transporter [Candidatus Bathyarchaeia archaeon]
MVDWFILAVLDAFFAAMVAIFAKIGLQGVDSNVATAVRAIVMVVFIVGFVVAMGKGPQLTQLTSRDMIYIVLSGVVGAISWLLYFAALKMADASKVAPVDRASLLFVLILSALILGEKITLKTALAGTLIFTGVLLLAI